MKLFAGAGEAEIRFDMNMFPLEGFCGIHDNPYLKVLILKGNIQAAVLSVDIVKLEEHNLDMIRDIVSEETGTDMEHIWIHMTHALTTPHPPEANRTPDPENADTETLVALYDKAINEAAREASHKAAELQEAEIYAGRAACVIHTSRNVKGMYGWWTGMNGEGLVDDEVTVLSFRNTQGSVIASVISFGLKPCAVDNSRMEQWERLVSSDLTGVACRTLEEDTHAPALYMMAAAGDMVPFRMAWHSEFAEDGYARMADHGLEYGFAAAEEFGQKLGAAAVKAEREAGRISGGSISCGKADFSWPEQGREGRLIYPVDPSNIFLTGRKREIPISALTLGDVAFVFTTPEMSASTGMDLKKDSPYPYTLLVTMTNGDMKYMPDALAYERGCWVASNSMCAKGAAEEFEKNAVQLLKDLRDQK